MRREERKSGGTQTRDQGRGEERRKALERQVYQGREEGREEENRYVKRDDEWRVKAW